ncbi:MAG: dephospho-CoA kinase [Deltaproteobacteria bacterium]|nr:dephospho-CoA kinase [Deltaproteobacteria bacterium]
MRVFGLTGGVASGKSAVAACLRARGVDVIDADQVSRDVVVPGSEGLAEVVAAFGDVLAADGTLDRKRLGQQIFADADARKRLEAILHPRIAAETARRLASLAGRGVELACYDAALLVERGLHATFRPLLVVAVPREVQRARLLRRDGIDAAEADRRIDSQLPLEAKVAAADFVIDNRGSLDELEHQVDRVLASIRTWEPPA